MARSRFLLVALLSAVAACTRGDGASASTSGAANGNAPARRLKAPAIGADAPVLAVTDIDERPVTLAALRDTVVVLNIWATWCQPCRLETPELVALSKTFADAPVRVIGVSIDNYGSAPDVRDFMTEFSVPYTVWLDPQKDVQAKFLTIGVPETFVIDKQGIIRARQIGGVRAGDSTLVTAVRQALAH
jgi:thiol-disulfide isomerase/thioredoxin